MSKTVVKTASMAAAGALLLGGGALVVARLEATPTASAAPAVVRLSDSAAAQVSPLFAKAQSSADELPSFLASGSQSFSDVIPTTTRFVGVNHGATVWIALTNDDKVALLDLLPGTTEYASETSVDANQFASSGIGLQASDGVTSIRAYYVPAGVSVGASGLSIAGPQFLTGDPNVTQTSPIQLPRSASAVAVPGQATEVTLPKFESVSSVLANK